VDDENKQRTAAEPSEEAGRLLMEVTTTFTTVKGNQEELLEDTSDGG
jgi:hypothetical protein